MKKNLATKAHKKPKYDRSISPRKPKKSTPHAHEFYISKFETYVSKLGMYVSKLETYVSRFET